MQFVHKIAELEAKVPAAQRPVTAVRLVVAQYEPPGHAVHDEDPIEA